MGRPGSHRYRGDAEQHHQRQLEEDHRPDARAVGGEWEMRLVLTRPADLGVMLFQLLPTAPGAGLRLGEPCAESWKVFNDE